ncbi:YitT family protein [Salirhabdus salicampi]|uniref:YitT family protein n=1 Tax=Salirhabdus salicampi TaxID=476102 RepID=UPI0020C22A6E|nr:YitT family protein [Salirhabdus salicampi]MCP8615878.1 YitT family protein [Salirhabdus salicampi]
MKYIFGKGQQVIAGGIIQGFGMGVFLFPNDIPSGGAGGLAVLINHLFHVHIGIALWIVNFSLLLLGLKYLGGKSVFGTLIAITVTSIFIFVSQNIFSISYRLVWVDLIIGSIFLGLGIGLLLRNNVSNGGIGVVALIISIKKNVLPGRPLFWINCSIFILTAYVIDWDILIYAFISQWISTKMVDLVCGYDYITTYTLSWERKS